MVIIIVNILNLQYKPAPNKIPITKDKLTSLVFKLILLGMIVYLMNLSGATHEYAKWASKKLKTKKQTLLVTMFLGLLIFVDDYFNYLTVGTIMRPIVDRNKVSREKLAYIIDSTAAPVCIIAPISSWAAAVSSSLPESSSIDGFQIFIKTIICNYYSWLSLIMVLFVIIFSIDFGKMRKYEILVEHEKYEYIYNEQTDKSISKGKVIDLLFPVIAIIIFSLFSMLYTGGFFNGEISFINSFANCDAIISLAMGAAYTVMFLALIYLPRKIVTPKQFLDGLVNGFINMIPSILILTFSWTLSGICGENYLNANGFVEFIVSNYNISLILMPAIFFIIALMLAFSTGTSWGTFAILLPIVISIFGDIETNLMVMTIAAVLGERVCGDHISPISDTTILSSTGAGCQHINHMSTQLWYGIFVASITFICYTVGAVSNNSIIGLITGIVLLFILVMLIKNRNQLYIK